MMKTILRCTLAFIIFTFTPVVTSYADILPNEDDDTSSAKIVIANRGSGSISIIDTLTDTLLDTVALPTGLNFPEPMYVVHISKANRVFVGDRANNRVVIFDDEDFSIEGSVSTGNGVFHMWADPGEHQLWVNNDIDNTATVIDPITLAVVNTVIMPQDLVQHGGKPHDVILDPTGDFAYITMLGVQGPSDYVIKFSTKTFQEVARAEVGKDPHVALSRRNKLLYVPCQNSDAVYVLTREDLSVETIIPVPGAHGAGMLRSGKTFYTTNLPGGGIDGLVSIDTNNNEVIHRPVTTPYPVPHNIAMTQNGHKLYITHSGASADKLTVYRVDKSTRLPEFFSEVTVGKNPFGLAFVR